MVTVWITRGISGGEGEKRTVPGTSTEPTLVTLARSVYKVVVAVKTIALVVLTTELETTSAVVATDVVSIALVMVEMAMEPVPAGPEKTEILSPEGAAVEPLMVWRLNGLDPEFTV
jgi:hypothetical protein